MAADWQDVEVAGWEDVKMAAVTFGAAVNLMGLGMSQVAFLKVELSSDTCHIDWVHRMI